MNALYHFLELPDFEPIVANVAVWTLVPKNVNEFWIYHVWKRFFSQLVIKFIPPFLFGEMTCTNKTFPVIENLTSFKIVAEW